MNAALAVILRVILTFVWGRVEDWVESEYQKQQLKRKIVKEVKDVAKQIQAENAAIADDPESIDDSLLRLERGRARERANRDQGGVDEVN